jgi:phosphoglycolate/pyridoxal phosphate phosphatase family enzyme
MKLCKASVFTAAMMMIPRITSLVIGRSSQQSSRAVVVQYLSSRVVAGDTDSLSSATHVMQMESLEELKKLANYYSSVSFPAPTIWEKPIQASNFVSQHIDSVLFDCDGVLYRTLDACPGASKCIQSLMDQGKNVLFVTNNGGINRRQLRDKLSKVLQIDALTEAQMVSSSYSCATYLKQQLLPQGSSSRRRRVHVIGSAGLCEEISDSGFIVSGGPSDDLPSMDRQQLADYDFDDGLHPIDAIVCGHDTEFNFRKLCIANNLLLRNPSALFVTTNLDRHDLVGTDSRHIPGNGCNVKALEYCSKRTAVNVGKPSKELAELIAKEHGLEPSRSLFVGDRLDTDIRFGNENGMKSLLVMTGVATADSMIEIAAGTVEEPLPNFIIPYIGWWMVK